MPHSAPRLQVHVWCLAGPALALPLWAFHRAHVVQARAGRLTSAVQIWPSTAHHRAARLLDALLSRDVQDALRSGSCRRRRTVAACRSSCARWCPGEHVCNLPCARTARPGVAVHSVLQRLCRGQNLCLQGWTFLHAGPCATACAQNSVWQPNVQPHKSVQPRSVLAECSGNSPACKSASCGLAGVTKACSRGPAQPGRAQVQGCS